MKNKTVKFTSVLLCVTMLLSIFSLAGCAKKEADIPAVKLEDTSATLPVMPGSTEPDKDETVYVFTSADGSVQNTIVSNWLKNGNRTASLEDTSELQNIENVGGPEVFTAGTKNTLIWDAQGNDIFYQGTTDKKPPVNMKITYTLDGKTISPENLAGKSGKVTIRFDYENHETVKQTVNGKQEDFYIPFIMATCIILDNDIFRNVSVKNGQVENMGNEIAIVGFALPGMQENLKISSENFEIPNYVEISADTENFELGPTMTIATTTLLKDLNTESLDIQELKDQAKQLTDGMGQLMDGAAKLYDGLNTLLDQTGALVNGVDQLASGATQLQTGIDTLTGGVSQLQAGAAQLSTGLSTLNANSAALNSGAQQVFNTLLSSATAQLNASGLSVPTLTIENYAEVLNGVIASLDETAVYQSALQQVTAGVEAKRGEIEAAVTSAVHQQVEDEAAPLVVAAVRENVKAAVLAKEDLFRAAVIQQATGMTPEAYQQAVDAGMISQEQQEAIEAAITAAEDAEIGKQMESAEIQAQIAAITEQKVSEKMATEELQAIIAKNVEVQVEKAISDTMASPEVQAKLQTAAEGAKTVIALKSSLDSYNGFYLGLLTYTSGVASAASGAADLNTGADTLKTGMDSLGNGANSLNTGIQVIHEKMPELTAGITALRDGSSVLKDGLNKLMDEGIQKITDLAEEDLADLTARLSACVEAGNNYNTFSGKNSSVIGTVKFVYKTDSISVQ